MLEVDVGTYLPDDLLAKVDIATMAHSLEARSPLLDHEFMALAASLPPRLKVRGRHTKVGLRGRPARLGPRRHPGCPEAGFVVPIAEWLRDGPARPRPRRPPGSRGARPRLVPARGRARSAGPSPRRVEDRSGAIWALLMLELWQRESDRAPPGARGEGRSAGVRPREEVGAREAFLYG